MGAKRPKKSRKLSGIVYFAQNYLIPEIVKIGMTIVNAEERLTKANKRNEFMPGEWKISQKVSTKNAKETEALAHELFEENRVIPSVSDEMYFTPDGMTVKDMADLVRNKMAIHQKQVKAEEKLKDKLKTVADELLQLQEANKQKLLNESDNP
jgi:hypothetical protein